MTILQGGCRRGKVRYQIDGGPKFSFACHCTDCQQLSSSAFSLALVVKAEDFKLVEGDPRDWDDPKCLLAAAQPSRLNGGLGRKADMRVKSLTPGTKFVSRDGGRARPARRARQRQPGRQAGSVGAARAYRQRPAFGATLGRRFARRSG